MNLFKIIPENRPVLPKINYKSVIVALTIKNTTNSLFSAEKS